MNIFTFWGGYLLGKLVALLLLIVLGPPVWAALLLARWLRRPQGLLYPLVVVLALAAFYLSLFYWGR